MSERIPLFDVRFGEEEERAVLEVMRSGHLSMGPKVEELEALFAEATGARYAVAVSTGTAALHLALLAHGIGEGDEVITTAFTFIASVNSILFVGAKPVLVDLDPRTYNIDLAQLEAAITPRTRALMPVDLYGQPCDMDAVMAIAERHGLAVIHDAAQSIGAEVRGRRVGSFGTACFSLYQTKNITAGEGGMITTNDTQIAERCRKIRNHGMQRRYQHEMIGYNVRLSDLHAAVAIPQMRRLEAITAHREANAAFLSAHITHPGVVKPSVPEGLRSVWNVYTLRVPEARDALKAHLEAQGIETGVFYPEPVHAMPHVKAVVGDVILPEAERAAREVLSLGVGPEKTPEQLQRMAEAINRWSGR